MKVAFMMGKRDLNKKLINTLENIEDSIDFYTYSNIAEMVKESNLRHVFYDRILLSEKFLADNGESELKALNEYIINYSDSTTVILVCNPEDVKYDKVFLELFNAPMYTPVLVRRVVTSVLQELVVADVLELKTKYYTLEEKEEKGLTSNYSVEKKADTPSQEKHKGGLLGGIFGSKKSKEVPKAVVPEVLVSPDVPKVEVKVEEDDKVEQEEGGFPIGGVFSELGEEIPEVPEVVLDDDDMLSIGDYGSNHSDTGFLDEDGEKEIEEYIKSQVKEPTSTVKNEKVSRSHEKVAPVAPKATVSKRNEIRVLTGVRGVGVTKKITTLASDLVVEKGKKVLIVDADFKENGVLSYIDFEEYYRQGSGQGINKSRIYREDGVGLVSNGYGEALSSDSLLRFLRGNIITQFDIVIIDCPLDCFSVISKEVLGLVSNVALLVEGNIGCLSSTSIAITNRDNVSLDVESYLMSSVEVLVEKKIKQFSDDLMIAKSVYYFPNGSWLDKIR